MPNQPLQLSPSKLNLFLDCPLCFWLSEVKKIHRPEGIQSTLPRGMDILIKKYFDKYRAKNELPPELVGKVEGKPMDNLELLKKWRHWKTGLRYEDKKLNATLYGALDECFITPSTGSGEMLYIPVDYKTRGFDLKEDSTKYYQTQLDCYTFFLEANGYKHPSFGYLIFYIPKEIKKEGVVRFVIEPRKIKTNPKAGLEVFQKAVNLLHGPQPKSHSECKYCQYRNFQLNDKK